MAKKLMRVVRYESCRFDGNWFITDQFDLDRMEAELDKGAKITIFDMPEDEYYSIPATAEARKFFEGENG